MARKRVERAAGRKRQRKRGARRAKPARRRSPAVRRAQRGAEAIEAVRRGPLEPELPVDPDAALAAVDPDALEVLKETQTVKEDQPPTTGGSPVDRDRGTVLTGGDVDAAWDEVDVGEETVGGSTPTPDQDVVDDLGRAAGVTYSDSEPLRPEEKVRERDEKRWEVDPASAEDYPERVRSLRRRRRR